eukprot:351613-Chlamydomonas_euryale.AAC.3
MANRAGSQYTYLRYLLYLLAECFLYVLAVYLQGAYQWAVRAQNSVPGNRSPAGEWSAFGQHTGLGVLLGGCEDLACCLGVWGLGVLLGG